MIGGLHERLGFPPQPSGILYLRRGTIIWSLELPRPRIYITLLSRSHESDKAWHFVGVRIHTCTHTRVRNARNSGDENPDNNFDRESRRTCGRGCSRSWSESTTPCRVEIEFHIGTCARACTRTLSFLYIVRVIKGDSSSRRTRWDRINADQLRIFMK